MEIYRDGVEIDILPETAKAVQMMQSETHLI